MPVPELRIFGVEGLPEVHEGDDVGAMVAQAAAKGGASIEAGDVVVVTQKIVSKAEGRVVVLSDVTPSGFAEKIAARYDKDPRLVEVVLQESSRVVRMDQGVIITETRHGFICANAGVDQSNVETHGEVALLPIDPDASAASIREAIARDAGVEAAVIISDTFGRPWREGCTDVAIGVAGMEALVDYRGVTDPAGHELRATVIAVADEIASAAELVMGKLDRVPAAIVRGYAYNPGGTGASVLVRPPEGDLFR